MYKDILVHIPTERPMHAVIDGAIALAAKLNAHVDAVAVGYIASSTAYVLDGGAAVAAVFEMERERAVERAEAALAIFQSEARNAGISCTCHPLGAIPADAAGSLGEMARLHDLSIVLQPDPAQGSFDNDMPGEILFQAGGPVLFLPYTFRGSFKANRIGICWDGSRLAARAMRDAAPLLARAEEIVIITINEADAVRDEVSASHLADTSAGAGCRPARSACRQRAPTSSRPSCRWPPTRASISWSWAATATHGCRNASSAASPAPCWRP